MRPNSKKRRRNRKKLLEQSVNSAAAPVVSDKRSRYQQYIQSAEWRLFRLNLFAKRGARCETCAGVRNLQVHHLTYARLGRELDEDVRILCEACHRKTHGLSVEKPNANVQKVAPGPTPKRFEGVRRGRGGFTVDRKGRPQGKPQSSLVGGY